MTKAADHATASGTLVDSVSVGDLEIVGDETLGRRQILVTLSIAPAIMIGVVTIGVGLMSCPRKKLTGRL